MVRYALVIGISEYNEPFDFLDKAARDADAVKQKLEKDGRYKITSLTSFVKGVDLYKGPEGVTISLKSLSDKD